MTKHWIPATLFIAWSFPFFCWAENHLMIEKANQLYHNQSYSEAANLYQELINDGYSHPDLLYNAGNAYYRDGQIGHAILCFRQSLESQWQERTYENLLFVQRAVQDNAYLESVTKETTGLAQRLRSITLNTWSLLSLCSFALVSAWLILRFNHRFKSPVWGIFPLMVYGFSTFEMCYGYYKRYIQYPMVVIKPSIPFQSEKSSGRTTLVEGMEFHVINEGKNTLDIKLPDGERGRIRIGDAEKW